MRSYILVLLVCISLFSLTSSRDWGGSGSRGGGGWGGGSKTGSSSGGWGGESKTGSSSGGWGGESKTGSSSGGWGGESKTGSSSGGWGGESKTGSSSGGWGGESKTGSSSGGWGGESKTGSSSGGWGGESKTGSSSGGWGGGSKTGSSPSDGSDTGSSSRRGSGSKTGTSSRGWGGGRRSGGWGGGSRSGSWGGSRKRGGGSFGSNANTKTIMGVGIGIYAGYKLGKTSSHFLYGGRPYYFGDRYYNTPPGYIRCNFSVADNSQLSQLRYDDRNNEQITQLVFSCPRNFRCCDADCCPQLKVAEADKEANFSGVVMTGGEGNETAENSTDQEQFISRLRKELAFAETDKEAMKRQPKSLQDEIDRLLLVRIQAYCSAFMAGGEGDKIVENGTEQEKLISKLRKELAFAETDKEAMKRQLKSYQDKFDRLIVGLDWREYSIIAPLLKDD